MNRIKMQFIVLLIIANGGRINAQEYLEGGDPIGFYDEIVVKSTTAPWPTGVTNRQIRYFPIQHHVVRTSNGYTNLPISITDVIVDDLNRGFNDSIIFYSCSGINYINNSNYYDFERGDENALRSEQNVAGVINLYYFNTILYNEAENKYAGGYAYYPSGTTSFIALRNSNAQNSSTPQHEFGHFFGLPHTFETRRWGDELVNGSNCILAGDRFCDTPAEPNTRVEGDSRKIRPHVDPNTCEYRNDAVRDAQGNVYTPCTRNFMGNSKHHCRNRFSPLQHHCMVSWANHANRLIFDRATIFSNQAIMGTHTYSNNQACGIIVFRDAAVVSNANITVITPDAGVILDRNFEVQTGASFQIQ